MTPKEFVSLLSAPAAIAAIVSWIIEFWEPFHALTPLGKKLAFTLGTMALAWICAGTGVWLGELVWGPELIVTTILAGFAALGVSNISHIPATGRR